ncbi:hypothetical protein JCM11251_006547 [Rhodosporidiobolus azoricus]
MSRSWDLYLTPTVTLSLLLEAESPVPSFARWASQWALYFRPLLLKGALQYELDRGGALAHNSATGETDGVISAATLRVVDSSTFRVVEGKQPYKPTAVDTIESLAMSISNTEGIDVPSLEHDLLVMSLGRVLSSYQIIKCALALAQTPYPGPEEPGISEAEALLRGLWETMRPEKELPGMVGKHWQELGFQNTSPSTDFRGVGLLGLRCLVHFASTYRERAAEIINESVGAGERWYPLALASLHMTAFALDLAKTRDLQLFLLRSLQTPAQTSASLPSNRPSSFPARSDAILLSDTETTPLSELFSPQTSSRFEEETQDLGPESAVSRGVLEDVGDEVKVAQIEPFLRLSSDLLLLFHAHWRQGNFTVMDFEQTSKAFQAALRPWIRRGVLDGRALGWEKWDEGGVKLD